MRPTIATYLTWADFNNGTPSSLDQFREALSAYQRDAVVALCSAINCVLRTWEGGRVEPEAHDALARAAFPPRLAELMIRERLRKGTERLVFHRQQLLFVAKSAILYCQQTGINPLAHPSWADFGKIFLMANDHLHFGFPAADAQEQQFLNILAEFIPVLEISGPSSIKKKAARAHCMTEIAAEFSDHADFVDLPAVYKGLTEMTIPEFRALCFASMSKYTQLDLKSLLGGPENFFLPREWFRTTALEPYKIDRFLGEVSSDGDSLRARFQERNAGASDFTPLKDRPFYAAMERFFALDAAFLGEKIETGMFWRVHGSLSSPEERQKLHRFWGIVFQEYMHRLISSAVDGVKNRYIASPHYTSDGGEVCDGMMLCGSSAILLEYKGATFTAESKYGGDPSQLFAAIHEKLIEPRGIRQLINALKRLFARGATEEIEGMEKQTIRKIYPVLVTRDDIGGVLTLNRLLNRKFQEAFDRRVCRPRIVTPLFCMNAENAEELSGYLQVVRFDEILDARYEGDPELMANFQVAPNKILDALGDLRSPFIDQGFHESIQAGVHLLFPGQQIETVHSRAQSEGGAGPNVDNDCAH